MLYLTKPAPDWRILASRMKDIRSALKKIICLSLIWRITMKTFMAKPEDVERKWYVIDAADLTLGRLATEAANILRGKNKPIYTPYVDCGDYLVIVNADKVKVTGKKMDQKIYFSHSKYVGGAKYTTLRDMLAKKPELVVEKAVRGMIPHGVLGDAQFKKLHVYAGPDHEQAAQKPEVVTLK
jgi:large subunit ribosomal protein L13